MVSEWKVTKNQGQKIAVTLRWTRKKATEQKKEQPGKSKSQLPKCQESQGSLEYLVPSSLPEKFSTYLLGPKPCVSPLKSFLPFCHPICTNPRRLASCFFFQDGIVVVFYFIYPTMFPHRQALIRLRQESTCLFSPKRQAVCDEVLCRSQAFPRPLQMDAWEYKWSSETDERNNQTQTIDAHLTHKMFYSDSTLLCLLHVMNSFSAFYF